MANEYDDLLESFMNNSAKVYDEDKKNLESKPNKKPAAYIESDKASKQSVSVRGAKSHLSAAREMPPQKAKRPHRLPAEFSWEFCLLFLLLALFAFP